MMWLWAFAVLGLIGLAYWIRRVQLELRALATRLDELEQDLADLRDVRP